MFNVLVAEDDKNIRKLMEIKLSSEGYNVFSAGDGEEALKLMENNQIDIMVVDIMMPKMDGYELVKTVRESNSQIPAIMVTAKGTMQDKAKGFLVGIDDYMVKPVEFDELLFRIKALLRRAKIVNERRITVGDVTLDYDTLSISGHGKKISLPKKDFSLLFKLLSYPERSFTKAQLFDEFWGYDSYADEDTIKVHINKIRSKIADFPEIDIETIRGIGYKGVRNEKA